MDERKFKTIAGAAFGILAAVIAILVLPNPSTIQNGIAKLELNKIGGVWFIPDGKSEDDIVWLDAANIGPLYKLLSSETTETNPSKWIAVGRVGFTYDNGRFAGVDLFDTKTDRGAFRFGETYFRYNGNAPELIKNAR